ncbi:hypothetical protein AAG570_007945, partial [Ranatra chinensis]
VAVGGNDGVLQIFSIKKGEIQLAFKTLPGAKISTLELGGAIGSVQDKIFISSKNEVRGYTKKGKLFLSFDTNLTETIKTMYVGGSDLLVTGTHVYNHYRDCKDTNSYLCGDIISSMTALSAENVQRLTPVLACEDRTLKILKYSSLAHNIPLPSAVTTLGLLNNDGGESGDQIVYGMENGQIGLVQISRTGIKWKWLIDNPKHLDAPQCMFWYDITRDGVKELIVGRGDGSIQVYSQPFEALSDNEPLVEKYNYMGNESIMSVQAGNVGNPTFDEIVATTFTGWFFGLTTEVLERQVSREASNASMSLKMTPEEKLKLDRLRNEIEEIEQKVNREREKYQIATQEESVGISTVTLMNITDKMVLIKEDSVFQLTIEAETAIDNVLLQSDVDIKLFDVEKNSAVVSYSVCQPNSGNKLLATYRCQVNTTKINILLQSGQGSGTLNVYITPHAQPKVTHIRSYPIKQLGLYTRIHNTDLNRSCNSLTLKGGFSMAEMHSWVSQCLPEIPAKAPINEKVEYYFVSSFIGTILHCSYMKGEAQFKSDDITAISTLKDFLTKEGTKRKINLDISLVINDESIKDVMRFIFPKLEKELKLKEERELYGALKDIELNEADAISNLSRTSRKILENHTSAQDGDVNVGNRLERLQGT